jgi:acetoin utilization protein AcuB
MTRNPVYVQPDIAVSEARLIMDREKVAHLTVLDRQQRLAGIVTRKDMLKAGPSLATSLDMYEISYLLSKLTIEKVMTKDVITVGENEVVEEAARTMADNNISCLPVMRGGLLVGIITVKDLFQMFVTAFGARHAGVRVGFIMSDRPGEMAKLAGAIAEQGGNIVSFVTREGGSLQERGGTLKITGLDRSAVEVIFRQADAKILDIR